MSEASNAQSSGAPVIPDKLYFRIGEVSRLLQVESHTLRFWETEFPQLKIGKGGTGQRLYRRRDVELVLEIKKLLYEQGYTIPGARQFLQIRHRRKDPVPTKPPSPEPETDAEEGAEPKLRRIRAELRNLSEMLDQPASSDRDAVRQQRTQPRSAPPRRGLHLASAPSSGKQRDAHVSEDNGMLGLFDSKAE